MRLHRLELSAFQAFPDTEVVDFDALADTGLFLMHGPTGAGKTTILDAICFAFYGLLPGARREGARLRSDHADATTLTVVELEATLRGRRVRIRRIPDQERPKARGEGTTKEAHSVTVVELHGSDETVLASGVTDAKTELDELLGMNADQFCQIVLLPQGRFATFLHAKSEDRRDILKELFDVGNFLSVESWLKDRLGEVLAADRESMLGLEKVVAQIHQASGETAPEGWQDRLSDVAGWAQNQLVVTEAGVGTGQGAVTQALATRQAATAALETAREVGTRQALHREARAGLEAWETSRAEHDGKAAELEAARRAAPVAPLVTALEARGAHLQGLPTAAPVIESLQEAGLVPADADASDLRAAADRLRKQAGAVGGLRDTEERCAGAARELARREASTEEIRRAEAAAGAWLEGAAAAAAELAARVEQAQRAEAGLAGLEKAEEAARTAHAEAVERDRIAQLLPAARDTAGRAKEAHLDAREQTLALQQQRLAGMASVLAARLADGKPCAVCGSADHPSPASDPEGHVPDEASLEAAGARAEELETARAAAESEVQRLESAHAATLKLTGERAVAGLEGERAAADAALAEARRTAAGLSEATSALKAHEDATGQHRAIHERAVTELAGITAQLDSERRALAGDLKRVAAACGGHETIEAHIRHLEEAAASADSAAVALAARTQAAAERDRARESATTTAVEAGFESVEDAAAAIRPELDQSDLDAFVRAWDERIVELNTEASRADLLAASVLPPADVAAAIAAAEEATRAETAAQQQLAVTNRRHGELEELTVTLAERIEAATPVKERLQLVRGLTDLVEGKSPTNRLRTRLTSYVLAARLEEVAAAATVRLSSMSSGRYELELAPEGITNRGRAGLDLQVVDAWTGRTRSPGTLSGGETFLASLALALGLADVVAAEAGGALLETLFVDEGFGSLDDEGTLDQVLDVLDGLRESGRTVGVVSHVPELRNRIPGRLQVEKTQSGSRLKQGVLG